MNTAVLNIEPSAIGSGLSVIAPALHRYGTDTEALFDRHDIELSCLSDPGYRLPVSCTASLWTDAAHSAGDEAFGLRAGSFAHPTMYHSLGMALWSSSSLHQLFDSWIEHLGLISTAAVASLVDRGDHYVFCGHSTKDGSGAPDAGDIAVDATLAALMTISRIHGDSSFAPLSVELTRAKPEQASVFEQFFACPVDFSSDQITLRLDKAQMDAPIPEGNLPLMREMERLSLEYIMRMNNKDLVGKLRRVLLDQLPNGGADQQRVADALHMSARTLHRKLRDRGTSYRQQLDEVRCELSLQYMKHEQLTVMDIAFQLGFSNCSNFARAFKRWVGKTPNEYRSDSRPPPSLCYS